MSRRAPMNAMGGRFKLQRDRMAPSGRLWSESPVNSRWTTEAGVLEEYGYGTPACGPNWWRDSLTSTSAHFSYFNPDGYRITGTTVGFEWVAGVATTIQWRLVSLDPLPSDPPSTAAYVPTPWVSVNGATGSGWSDWYGYVAEPYVGYTLGFTIEWDVSGGFTDICAVLMGSG